jgi:hypothetical protein
MGVDLADDDIGSGATIAQTPRIRDNDGFAALYRKAAKTFSALLRLSHVSQRRWRIIFYLTLPGPAYPNRLGKTIMRPVR